MLISLGKRVVKPNAQRILWLAGWEEKRRPGAAKTSNISTSSHRKDSP
jgi:hypothetical protein